MIGKEVLNYVIVSEIGVGGMGAVYLAEHKYIKNQKVAIKVIKGNRINETAKQRLKEEAEHLASLNHPNIVKFLNYDIDQEGNVYLIMEYAEGVTLDRYIRTKTGLIVESKILPLFEPILDAFDYAHKHHVIHRDIKPSNIIITNEGTPKILDFGISTIMDDAKELDAQEVYIMGTPSFMSPEQVRGRGIDTRSDIYSLGVMLHQMLTGNAPYDTTTMSELDIQEKVLSEPLPRMKAYYKYISDKLQAVVDKATSKNPGDRYQTCADFKKSLRKAIIKDPVPKSTIAIIAGIAAVLVLVGGFFWDYNRVKVRYYKDYAEQWGIPQGIGKISLRNRSHMTRMYRFEYQYHKLQRVSHVNSYGKIIDDDESERYERPIDQRFFYSAEKKISQIKAYDKSGRCVYVKSYNDKLNSVVFQYDDEFGTEKSLAFQTIGYIRTFDVTSGSKSKISRWLLEYNENGYVTKIEYAGYQNTKVGDANGIYGRTYVRDQKGRVLEERYHGFDGVPKATSWGLGMKKFMYDEKDNWVRSEYYTIDGKPALDAEGGLYVFVLEYDKYGNLVSSLHEDSEGKLMLPQKNGIAANKYVLDNHGFQVERIILDVDKNPGYPSKEGYSKVVVEYDSNGYDRRHTFYDVEGNLCETSEGNSSVTFINDDNGNVLEVWYQGIDGNLVECTSGYAGVKAQYDEIGQRIELVYYGVDKKPFMTEDGLAGYRNEYNSLGLVTKQIHLDTELQPTYNENGVAIIRIDYDQRGNMTKLAYYDDKDKKLTLNNDKIAGWNSTFDDFGNEIARDYFDTKGERCLHSSGISGWTSKYDDQGRQTQYRYYNLKKDLVSVDGVAGYDYKYDEKGNMIESTPIGTDGKPSKTKLSTRYKYDANDNVIRCSLYDGEMKPALNSYDYHKYTCQYNNRNQMVEIKYYGKKGELVKYNGDNYAIRRDEYNDRGFNTKTSYYGVDGNPVACKQGWASSVQEFDSMGHTTRRLFYNTSGKPTDPKQMVPEVVFKYDKWGNTIYTAVCDGKGNLIMSPEDCWSIVKTEYDSRGNRLSVAFFNEKENPIKGKNGYHKALTTYTSFGKEHEESFYGINGEPVNCDDGYHRSVYSFNENHNYLTYKLYDTKDNPTNCNSGYHKIEWIYGEDKSIAKTRKYISSSGSTIYVESWNGNEWVPDRTTVLRTFASNVNKNCPIDFGEDWGSMTLTSINVVNGSTVQFIVKVPYSKYELSSENINFYRSNAANLSEYFRTELRQSMSLSGITTVTIVNDRIGRELCRVTK